MNYGTLLSLLQTFIEKLCILIYYLLILNDCSLLFLLVIMVVQQMFRMDRHFVFASGRKRAAFTFISVMQNEDVYSSIN